MEAERILHETLSHLLGFLESRPVYQSIESPAHARNDRGVMNPTSAPFKQRGTRHHDSQMGLSYIVGLDLAAAVCKTAFMWALSHVIFIGRNKGTI